MAASVQIWRSSYTLFYSYFEIESICFDFFFQTDTVFSILYLFTHAIIFQENVYNTIISEYK